VIGKPTKSQLEFVRMVVSLTRDADAAWVHVGVIVTPLGDMVAVVDDNGAVLRLEFARECPLDAVLGSVGRDVALERDDTRLSHVAWELGEYFGRTRRDFSLARRPAGTPFQQQVWRELQRIPYGATATYGDLARRLGNAKLVRAVGGANAANPIAIVIPCHRVVGADGTLVGYGGGLELKQALLELEGARSGSQATAEQRRLPFG
jgi:methylated-DNA-[protein]-cysteine S-methyltransferase